MTISIDLRLKKIEALLLELFDAVDYLISNLLAPPIDDENDGCFQLMPHKKKNLFSITEGTLHEIHH